jgi:hypothetical protein
VICPVQTLAATGKRGLHRERAIAVGLAAGGRGRRRNRGTTTGIVSVVRL